jgi:hypothetical protein
MAARPDVPSPSTNLNSPSAFEEFDLEADRNDSFELEPDGVKRVHDSHLTTPMFAKPRPNTAIPTNC